MVFSTSLFEGIAAVGTVDAEMLIEQLVKAIVVIGIALYVLKGSF